MSLAAGLSRLGDESQYRMRSVTLCECSWQAGLGSSPTPAARYGAQTFPA